MRFNVRPVTTRPVSCFHSRRSSMTTPLSDSTLPNLLYVGDVPVEATYHGSALLYRLLEEYPPERLLIIETEPFVSTPEQRLNGVPYKKIALGAERLMKTGFTNSQAYGACSRHIAPRKFSACSAHLRRTPW